MNMKFYKDYYEYYVANSRGVVYYLYEIKGYWTVYHHIRVPVYGDEIPYSRELISIIKLEGYRI